MDDDIKTAWNSGYKSGLTSDNTDMLAALDKITELERQLTECKKDNIDQIAKNLELMGENERLRTEIDK